MRLKNKLKIHRTFYSPPQFNKIEFIPLNKLRINRSFSLENIGFIAIFR
ncbi:hypothetical protein CF65_01686 [Aggregatibacter actinomycetemcomitans HK1651]|nr:hypothetical protein CF65_01686 [Aggregatibacter actinomycetemcomitans HK1651]